MPSFVLNNNKVGTSQLSAEPNEKDGRSASTFIGATSLVEVSIACRELTNLDILSKSDPMCVVYYKPVHSVNYIELLRTETIQNNLDPDFVQKLTLEYRFEQAQQLKFEVYDIDGPNELLVTHDLIGWAECTAANIVSAGPKGYTQDLRSPKDVVSGKIVLTAEEMASAKTEVFMVLAGRGVGSCWTSCLMPKSFFTISKCNEGDNYILVYRSKKRKGMNPLWLPMTIPGQSICNGDLDRKLRFDIYRINLKGEDHLIGSTITTLNKMTERSAEIKKLHLECPKGKPMKTSLNIVECTVEPVYTFVDFVQAGTQLHLCFAIDFTYSNGDPNDPKSLHHISNAAGVTNPYEQAIESAGNVMKDYDDDGIFPVYGFGAIVPPNGFPSDEFNVTLTESANCKGIHGILRAYRNCVSKVKFFGPKNYAPIINRVASMASESRPGQHYYILVILTDGVLPDLSRTLEAIVNASVFPLSIIIVGVGDADFTAMSQLDGDEETVSYLGKKAERDIVQFVEYRHEEHWMRRAGGSDQANSGDSKADHGVQIMVTNPQNEKISIRAQAQLAQEMLAEIPDQFLSYMQSRGIAPSMVVMMDD